MYRLELLGTHHDRASFDCGVDALNAFLRQTARQHMDRGISRTFVLIDANAETATTIAGYFALSACEGNAGDLPLVLSKKLPRKIPAARIGRLAVAKDLQGQGIGSALLMGAIRGVSKSAESIGIAGLFVDAKDGDAASFYKHHGFIVLPYQPLVLFLPLAALRESIRLSE